ncbi:MAG TPA: ATP-dependent DNA ligase [Candidatus Pacearchaeota archaeon]|jgi:DNA ligase-1|nr:ATP-dependent DNA ligase [Candidatus Pacearchaeota archaeon]
MKYNLLAQTYQELENNSSRLKKIEILSIFLNKLKNSKLPETIYLLQGRAFPDYSEKEFGISEKLAIRALAKASGVSENELVSKWKKLGDLGLVAEEVIKNKKQGTLFSQELTTKKVLENLRKLPELIGRGTVNQKLALISELLTSAHSLEAKYIVRTLIGDLRIGVASGTLRDSIVQTCFKPKSMEEKKEFREIVQNAYDKATDIAVVFEKAQKGIKELQKIKLTPGHPIKLMLAQKAESIEDGFDKCGSPCAFEYKYDGFRMLMNKQESGEIRIFTRNLDEVSKQFPEVVEYLKKHIKAKSFMLDGEAIGFDPKTKKYKPFEAVSQRIKRKHNIEELIKKLPIEVNAFDILYLDGKSLIDESFENRTKLLRKLIRPQKHKFRYSHQLITSDAKKAKAFYDAALKDNQEGVMIKNLKANYKPGLRVGHMLKLKPAENELDLVITSAEYGKGKRVGIFSSFTLSCKDEDGNLLEMGKASTGLKEKGELGLSYGELTNLLKPLIKKEHGRMVSVKPEVIVTIVYQNIQRSPTYDSGFALRFPRITQLRTDRGVKDIATTKEIAADYNRHELKIHY